MTVLSTVYQRAEADGLGIGVGLGAGVGVINPTSTSGGTTTTSLNGLVTKATTVTVRSVVDASVRTDARAVATGIAAGVSNVTSIAQLSPAITASVGGSVTASSDVVVEAAVATKVEAYASAVSVSGAVAIGTLTVRATDRTTVTAGATGSASVRSTGGDVRLSALHNFAGGKFVSTNNVLATVRSLGVSLLFQTENATAQAQALATVTSSTQASTNLSAPNGTVTVESRGGNFATAAAKTSGGAAIKVGGDFDPQATANGHTSASLLGSVRGVGTGPGAARVDVVAEGTEFASSSLDASSGGAINIATASDATATVGQSTPDPNNPNVSAQLGGSSSVIVASGVVSVLATANTDADASTRAGGGGAVSVSTFRATASATPNVATSVGASANITARTITVAAAHNVAPPEYSDGTFNAATAVNAATNSITFTAEHGLSAGQVVTYHSNGNASIGGLTDGRSYSVVVPIAGPGVDPLFTLQLGSAFTGAMVDAATDEIRFGGRHSFVEGDRVMYMPAPGVTPIGGLVAGQVYRVHVVDETTIKLLPGSGTVPAPVTVTASAVGVSVINAANTFSPGQAVTYRSQSGLTFGAESVELITTGNNSNQPAVDAQGQPQYGNNDWIFLGRNPDASGQYTTGHGFNTGDAVVYKRTGGNGSTIGVPADAVYYVIKVDDYRFRLADSLCHATGCDDPDGADGPGVAIPQQFLALSADRAAGGSVVHSISRADDAPLDGLTDGQVYFVTGGNAASFQLAATPGGPAITFGAGGHTGGSHRFAVEGIDLTVDPDATGSDLHQLVFDITAPGSGTQTLEGVGGIGTSAGAPSGDLRSSASSAGSTGGAIDIKTATATSSVAPRLSLTIGSNAQLDRPPTSRSPPTTPPASAPTPVRVAAASSRSANPTPPPTPRPSRRSTSRPAHG